MAHAGAPLAPKFSIIFLKGPKIHLLPAYKRGKIYSFESFKTPNIINQLLLWRQKQQKDTQEFWALTKLGPPTSETEKKINIYIYILSFGKSLAKWLRNKEKGVELSSSHPTLPLLLDISNSRFRVKNSLFWHLFSMPLFKNTSRIILNDVLE